MAIRIPKPSGASASVGGSTIRIPTDRKTTVNLPSTNLLSSVPNAIAPAFDKLTQFLEVVSERKKANDRRIEEKRIRDKNTKNRAKLDLQSSQFLEEEINANKDILTDEGYDLLLKDFYKKQEAWLNTEYKNDPDAKASFLSDKIASFNTTYKNLKEKKNLQVIAEGRIVFDTATQTVTQNVTDLPVDEIFWDKVNILINEEKTRWTTGIVEGYVDQKTWLVREKELLLSASKKAVSAGKTWFNPVTQQVEPDNLAIYAELTAAQIGKAGEEFVRAYRKIRPDLIEDLLTFYKGQAANQKTIMDGFAERENREIRNKLTNDLITIQENGPEAAILAKDFLERVKNWKHGSKTDKQGFTKIFLAWQGADKSKPWLTLAGQNATTMANILIQHGIIDTKTELQFVSELYAKRLISHTDYNAMNVQIEQNIKIRNLKKGNLMKRALQMIATEIGSPELMEMLKSLEATDTMTPDEIKSLLGVQLSQEVYDSLNYFLQVLGVGEKEGFSYEGMLIKGQTNFVLDDVLNYLKAARDKRGYDYTLQFLKEDPIHKTFFDPNKPYHLAPDVWFEGKTPIGGLYDVPKRNADETFSAWINRTIKVIQKEHQILPSPITGFQFDEDADLNSIFLLPSDIKVD